MNYSLEEEAIERFIEKIKGFIMPSKNNNYKSRFLQSDILLYCVVLLLALKIITILVSINLPQNVFFADITKSTLENFVNQTRQSIGLQPLSENEKLDQAAQLKAENMVQDQYFDHTSPSGVSPWFWFSKAGYNYKYAGENLAIGFYDSQEVYQAWLNSPSHKANIVNPNYKEVGTAVLSGFGQNNTIVVVQEFGSQQPAKPVSIKNSDTKTQPVVKPSEQAGSMTPTGEKVLSQSIESQNTTGASKLGISLDLYYKAMNSVLYNYDGLLQDIVYGVFLVVIGILFVLIIFNIKFNFGRKLVFRSILLVVLLSLAALLNKGLIISIIPHQIII